MLDQVRSCADEAKEHIITFKKKPIGDRIGLARSAEGVAGKEDDAGLLHRFDGLFGVVRLEVDAAAAVGDEEGPEALLDGVQSGELDAVVGGEAHDVDVVYALALEVVCQAGGLAMAVVEEAAVAVDLGIGAFVEGFGDAVPLQSGDELGAGRALDAVDRPEDL